MASAPSLCAALGSRCRAPVCGPHRGVEGAGPGAEALPEGGHGFPALFPRSSVIEANDHQMAFALSFISFHNRAPSFLQTLLLRFRTDKVCGVICHSNCLSPSPAGHSREGTERLETHLATHSQFPGTGGEAGTTRLASSCAGGLSCCLFCLCRVLRARLGCPSALGVRVLENGGQESHGLRSEMGTLSPERFVRVCRGVRCLSREPPDEERECGGGCSRLRRCGSAPCSAPEPPPEATRAHLDAPPPPARAHLHLLGKGAPSPGSLVCKAERQKRLPLTVH